MLNDKLSHQVLVQQKLLVALFESNTETYYISPPIVYDSHKKDMEPFFTTRSLNAIKKLNLEDDIDGLSLPSDDLHQCTVMETSPPMCFDDKFDT